MGFKEDLIRMLFNEDVEKYRVDAGRREATIARQDSCIQELNAAVENLGSELADSHDTNTRLLADAERFRAEADGLRTETTGLKNTYEQGILVNGELRKLLLPKKIRYENVKAPVIILAHGDFDGLMSAAIAARSASLRNKRSHTVFDRGRDWHEYLALFDGREIYVLDMPFDENNYRALMEMQDRKYRVIVISDKDTPPPNPPRHFSFILRDGGRFTTAQIVYDYLKGNGMVDDVSNFLRKLGVAGDLGNYDANLRETAWRLKKAVDLNSADIAFMQHLTYYLAQGRNDPETERLIEAKSQAYDMLEQMCYQELLGNVVFEDDKRIITRFDVYSFWSIYHPVSTTATDIRSQRNKSVFVVLSDSTEKFYKLIIKTLEDVYAIVDCLKDRGARGGGHGTAASMTFHVNTEREIMRVLRSYPLK